MRMSVIGTGYLGATHAVCMAELGHDVLGVDVDEAKISTLLDSKAPFFEPDLPELLAKNIAANRLNFSTNIAEAAKFAHLHFLCVGTPQKQDSFSADLDYAHQAIRSLVPLLDGKHIIFGKSTVPVGTADQLQQEANSLAKPGTEVIIAWNPEFLREGFAVPDTLRPDRIVIGATPEHSAEIERLAREVYADSIMASSQFFMMDLPTAELTKVAANAFLATKISFINAVSEICEASGADVTMLADAIGADKRIGRRFLGAGLGFGGGCLPKDIRAFMARAGELGADQALTFLREVDSINMRRRDRVVQMAKEMCGGSVLGKRITVLGAAFKPHSDDVRDSPALSVAGSLFLSGAATAVYDPQAMNNARRVFPTLNYAPSTAAALKGADLVILATEWPEFRQLDPEAARKIVRRPAIIDGRNILPVDNWKNAGWNIQALGRNL